MLHFSKFRQALLFTMVTCLWLLLSETANAAQDSKGREFWITFMQNYSQPTLQLFITSEVNTKGTVEIPGLTWSTQFTVTADVTTTVNIPSDAVLYGTGIQNKAIHVVADNEVTVYGLNREVATTDAFLALPIDVLNTQYYIMSYANTIVHNVDSEEFALVPIFDNTTIRFTIPGSVTQTVNLNKGQAYQYLRPGTDGHVLTGTKVESDKPIAVFGGNTCTNIPWYMNVYACDHIEEQIPPLVTWGKQFYTVPLATRFGGDTFVILSGANGTGIDINGERKAILNAGQLYEQIIEVTSVISTTGPALVAQYSNSSSYDNVTSDPFMMLVPPVEQSLSHYTFSTPGSGFAINYVNIVAPTSAIGSIKLDQYPIDTQLFSPIPGTIFSGGQISVGVGSHTMDGLQRFGIHSYGYASYDSYGYPGAMAFEVINPGLISLAPAILNLGTFDINNLSNINEDRTLQLLNKGSKVVTINSIALEGNDLSDYVIVSVNDFPVNNTYFYTPFTLWPYGSLNIKVGFSPQHTPSDARFDATLTVNGVDAKGYAISSAATLVANLSSTPLSIDILDASSAIEKLDSNSVPLSSNGTSLDEKTVSEINCDQKRAGLVADGNARLLIRSKVNKTTGYVTFNIKQPSESEAKISGINFSSNNDTQMHTSVIVPIASINGSGQATAILRAAERFSAGKLRPEANIDIEVCYQEQLSGPCLANEEIRVIERRAPVILIHGLWASEDSWHGDSGQGMAEQLEGAFFRVGFFNYNDNDGVANRGPSLTMNSTEKGISDLIKSSDGLCNQLENEGFACTRSDIVAHSMGGLVARKYINDNVNYKTKLNFNMGSIRRLFTLGTPYEGSQLANFLRWDNQAINNCIIDGEPDEPGLQNNYLSTTIWILDKSGYRVESAIEDLAVGSNFINSINSKQQTIPIFALYGDAGTQFNFGRANDLLNKWIGKTGCTHATVFGNDMHSDGIVPENSSTASTKKLSSIQEISGDAIHVGMGTNANAINDVLELLIDKKDRFADGI